MSINTYPCIIFVVLQLSESFGSLQCAMAIEFDAFEAFANCNKPIFANYNKFISANPPVPNFA